MDSIPSADPYRPRDEDDEPRYTCRLCWDEPSGWLRPRRCDGDDCGRRKKHAVPHYFTVRCSCWLRKHAESIRALKGRALEKGTPVPSVCHALDDLEAGIYRWV